ncbi:acyl-CoA dehydrogenase family protein, partial [Burkholderia humptydooensis]
RGGLPATVARRDGDGWRVSGHKLYSTGIPALRWLAVWARTDEAPPRVGVFLVPRDAACAHAGGDGIRVIESWNHLGLRASGSHEVVFDGVRIPLDHAVDLRAPDEWARASASQADVDAHADQQAWMIVLLGSLYDAVAQAARDWVVGFASERAPAGLGAPLATLPRVQEIVGEIDALLQTNRVLLDDASARADAGAPLRVDASGLVKFTVTNHAIRVTELALQLSGNHGLSRHNPLERHHRDVLCSRIHTPQNDSILVAAGRAAFTAHRDLDAR